MLFVHITNHQFFSCKNTFFPCFSCGPLSSHSFSRLCVIVSSPWFKVKQSVIINYIYFGSLSIWIRYKNRITMRNRWKQNSSSKLQKQKKELNKIWIFPLFLHTQLSTFLLLECCICDNGWTMNNIFWPHS